MLKGFLAWVWVAYKPFQRRILGFWLSWNRNSIQAGLFLESLVMAYGRHPVWTDGAPWYHRCRFGEWLWRGLYRHKDRTECFDDHYPCRRKNCTLGHVWRWLNLFQLFSQPETLTIIHSAKGVMTMAQVNRAFLWVLSTFT
ncbi:MAG: hypothetical protein QXI97_04320 [Nitrososphaerota archaeon]